MSIKCNGIERCGLCNAEKCLETKKKKSTKIKQKQNEIKVKKE